MDPGFCWQGAGSSSYWIVLGRTGNAARRELGRRISCLISGAGQEGWKDVFQLQPGEWLTVAGRFTGATGEFIHHCHILDHGDEGMMRPFVVHLPEVARFHVRAEGSGHGGHGGHS